MSVDTVGASLGQMATLRTLFDRKAADVELLIQEISAAVGAPGSPGSVAWTGQVAERFRQDWAGTFTPQLRNLIAALRETGAYVERNRQNISLALNGSAA